jgi:ERCC4-type nuclease
VVTTLFKSILSSSESQYDDAALENYFLDQGINPIQIKIIRSRSKEELADLFNDLKTKIGSPATYELTAKQRGEIEKLKMAIAEKELAERVELEQKRVQKEKEEMERQLEEMVECIPF